MVCILPRGLKLGGMEQKDGRMTFQGAANIGSLHVSTPQCDCILRRLPARQPSLTENQRLQPQATTQPIPAPEIQEMLP